MKDQYLKIFEIDDLADLPSAVMRILFGDTEQRDCVYRKLLRLWNYDLSVEHFSKVYEQELSERKDKKQDFTPQQVSELCAMLTQKEGIIHEPTAGNGSMIISYWWNMAKKLPPHLFKPSDCIISAWELSNRSLPILLLNLSIRGIMGEVYHGDVLEQKYKNRYVLLNEENNPIGFSKIVINNEIQ